MNFSFLSNLSQIELPSEAKATIKSTKGQTVSRIPAEGSDFRLTSKGLFTPSISIAEKHELGYVSKFAQHQGKGIDVVPSDKWVQYGMLIDAYRRMQPEFQPVYPLFIAFTDRTFGGVKTKKLDVFATCKYDESGEPKGTIFSQATTYTDIVDDVLRLVYGEDTEPVNYFDEIAHNEISREEREAMKVAAYDAAKTKLIGELVAKHFPEGFVDLKVDWDSPFTINSPKVHIPKKAVRGANKGGSSSVDREGTTIFYPISVVVAETIPVTEEVNVTTEVVEPTVTVDEQSINDELVRLDALSSETETATLPTIELTVVEVVAPEINPFEAPATSEQVVSQRIAPVQPQGDFNPFESFLNS